MAIIFRVFVVKVEMSLQCDAVNKEGRNKGRFFYACPLPMGFSNDPKARCNFFVWDDDVI